MTDNRDVVYQGPVVQQPPAEYESHPPQTVIIQPVTVKETIHHHHDDINDEGKLPVVSRCMAVIILVLNIFLPGWGTVLLSFSSDRHCCYWFAVGILQFFLVCIIVGWIWSIITGVRVCQKAY